MFYTLQTFLNIKFNRVSLNNSDIKASTFFIMCVGEDFGSVGPVICEAGPGGH